MKTRITSIAVFVLISILLGGCCTTRTDKYTVKIYTPVYKKLSEVRDGFKVESPRDLKNPGKIYVYGKYLFINEKDEGIHIIDNANPAAPVKISFIAIPGNGDIAVKSSILYADSYVDLVAVDISDPRNPRLTKRVTDIFPNLLDLNNQYVDPEGGILVEWKTKDSVITYSYRDCGDNYSTSPVYGRGVSSSDGNVKFSSESGSPSSTSSSNPSTTGKGGSTARFTISSNYLYCVDRTNLITFDLNTASDPKPWNRINIGWNIETIFPYKDKLFIGSTTGMYIYNNSNPTNPYQLCQFSHARSCDPVVADDKYAYVTLRSTATRCAGNVNELQIIDISDIRYPKLVKTYSMLEPYGLGVDGTTVFVCDGKAGLKVFDATKPDNILLINWQSDINASDIIPLGGTAILIGTDGLYQYDYTNPKNLVFLSKIGIK